MQQATGSAVEKTVGTARFSRKGRSPRPKRPYVGISLRWTGLESLLKSGPTRPGSAASWPTAGTR